MTVPLRLLAAVLMAAAFAGTLGAQEAAAADSAPRPLSCGPGTTLRVWTGRGASASDTAGAPARAPSAPRTGGVDTVITLAIADRTWTRDSLHAGVALGASSMAGARGAPWRACAGATTHLGRVTARLHHVYGTIRLLVSPGALESIGRATPPAGPPRR